MSGEGAAAAASIETEVKHERSPCSAAAVAEPKRRRVSTDDEPEAAAAGSAPGAPSANAVPPAGRGVAPAELDDKGIERYGTDEAGYEYLDHTADIQLHSWGRTLQESLEQVVVAMFGYMTELDKVVEDPAHTTEVEVDGHDLDSLLFALLDEFLFQFVTEPFVACKRVKIVEFDQKAFKIKAQGFGEVFDLAKHEQGTEIKAITYSNMQIHSDRAKNDIYVIVDI
eukprot:CAMPEP_0182934972 /NCGR_PEP_ID=MMETSP0105_2-20130417/37209_1 /TAXON_ID=81532 ORGANISM="Acanthoeca-like sp., Strain 10tr" /NCGR_SAMPLE_ID=MMETSP0105_2 /ASSEMBLY_ACC=CAM_ASM_000205 /LENGTH=225 /DNA_ID=CAMNT_0025073907 /DNA_START=138 /DNA_END=815 /DNA_ORIENTATION=-